MNNLKHIIEGALYAAGATFLAHLSDSLEALHLPQPWPGIMLGVIGVLAWARAKLESMEQ